MPHPEPSLYFREARSFAAVKQELIGKCFEVWACNQAPLITHDQDTKLHFIDLNAVSGHCDDTVQGEALETWRQVLQSTAKSPRLQQLARFYASDPVKAKLSELQPQLESLPAYEALAAPFSSLTDTESKSLLAETLDRREPSFMFMDPFSHGYAQEMLLKALQPDRPSDILLQFKPDSIRKALTRKKVSQSVLALFGERLSLIQGYCRKEKDNTKREEFMVQHLHSLLRAQGLFTLLFRINQPGTGLADHYALFVTQNAISYNGYKRTILPYSDYQKDGVPLLVANQGEEAQLSLFPQQARYTVALLREELAENATAYKFKSVEKVFELHSPNTPYTPENYLAAFERLRDAGNVELLNGKTLQTVRKATLTSVVKFLV